ncbi:MAG: septum formation inhibitor Maf [Lachnospiraceae bacterium]|nr:septum formation inhibitor Maf [Lachnospiraceae bacterium]
MRLILASKSPRRRELLAQIGLPFVVRESCLTEEIKEEKPEEIVKSLAFQKAEAVAEREEEEAVILGADTVVVLDGEILGKPKDAEDAFRMLQALQGREHTVCTGVALLRRTAGEWERVLFAEKTKVFVRPMSGEEIRAYIATGEPMDKAGAYGIQGRFAVFVEKIDGDYANVVGLPVSRVYQVLKKWRQ